MLSLLMLLSWSIAAPAEFDPENPPEPGVNFTLTTSCTPATGGTTSPGTGEYTVGTTLSVSVSVKAEYRFERWIDDNGNTVSTEPAFDYSMPAHNVNLRAVVVYDPESPSEPVVSFTLTTQCSPATGGSTSPSTGVYTFGEYVLVSITQNESYRFERWIDEEGNTVSRGRSFFYTMPARDVVLTAVLQYDPLSPEEPGDKQVATPNIVLDEVRNIIEMSTSTEGATIYYTADGSEPSETSTQYTSPLPIAGNLTYKAIAYAEDYLPSAIRTYSVTGLKAPIPELRYTNLQLLMSVDAEDAEIRYTLDGTYPTEESPLYSGPVTLTEDCTVRACSFRNNYDPSDVAEYQFIRSEHQVATPALVRSEDGMNLLITSATAGAEIHYTDDGNTPSSESPLYTGPIILRGNLTYKAIAFKSEMFPSEEGTISVTGFKCEMPAGNFAGLRLTLTAHDTADEIRYTTDGTDPTRQSTLYTGPLALTEDCTVKARSFRDYYDPSEIYEFEFVRSEYQVAAPSLSISDDGQSMVISCQTEGAEIRYTTDGSTPDAESTLYTGPTTIIGNVTYQARAFKTDMFPSEVGRYVVTGYKCEMPAGSFAGLRLTLTARNTSDEIRYTIDGTEPTAGSSLYTEPLSLNDDCTVRARSFREYYDPSDTYEFEFVRSTYQVSTPSITLSGDGNSVVMGCGTEGAAIRYTMDGSNPTAESTLYTGPVTIIGNVTYRAVAFKDEMFPSEVAQIEITGYKCEAPTATYSGLRLTLAAMNEYDQIRYTLDGTDPTIESNLYTEPLSLSEDCTVKARSFREYYDPSEVTLFEFIRSNYQVAKPSLNISEDGNRVIMSCVTEDAEIRYTNNGTIPTTESTLYTEPIAITGNLTYIAMAFKADMFPSDSARLTITDRKCEAPTATYAGLRLTLNVQNEADQIRYTLDGTEPTAESTLYTEPLALTEDCTVKARSFRPTYDPSDVTVFEFRRTDHQVATPEVTRDDTDHIVMTTTTAGATIRYTADGSEPNEESTEYTAPIPVTGNLTYRAIAYAEDLFPSAIGTYTVTGQKAPQPVANYAALELTLTLTVVAEDAEIRYTLDGTEPTEESTLYTEPLALTEDCTVKARSFRPTYDPSDVTVFEFRRTDHQVDTPVITRDETDHIVMTTTTAGATIRYTADGSEPNEESTEYTAPIPVTGNLTYRAIAYAEDLFPSAIGTYTVTGEKAPKPVAEYAILHLTLTVSAEDAEIRYTLDGTEPTNRSNRYSGPIELTEDCTVLARSFRRNYDPSEVTVYEFRRADHQAEAPEIRIIDNTYMVMSTTTEGAEILFTINGNYPDAATGTLYTEPFPVPGNFTYRAVAYCDTLFASDETVLVIDDRITPAPTARYQAHHLILSCPDVTATIYYTTDGSRPGEGSAVYTAPIELTGDVTVRFAALSGYPGYEMTEGEPYVFELALWKLAAPTLDPDYVYRTVDISAPAGALDVDLSGDRTVSDVSEMTVTVETGMTYLTAIARATDEDYYDSDPSEMEILFNLPPVFDYNIPELTATVNPADPLADDALCELYVNDWLSRGYGSVTTTVNAFGLAEAMVYSSNAFRSDPAEMEIDLYNDGTRAGVRNGRTLDETFMQIEPDEPTELSLSGELHATDFRFMASYMTRLADLRLLWPYILADDNYDGALAGAAIELIELGQLPDGLLRDMPRLAEVVWSLGDTIPAAPIAQAGNPNLLIWTADSALARYVRGNVVSPDPDNADRYVSAQVTLSPGKPFRAHREFDAARISLTKSFDQLTVIGVCSGWETLVLPFTPQQITHATQGEIEPFAAWDGSDSSPRPFWLYRATADDWEAATEIEAGVPYIISMPNNPEYVDRYVLGGEVTFSASDIRIDGTCSADDWIDGMTFHPTFMPLSGNENDNVLSLNSYQPLTGDDGEELLPGSVFTAECATHPFGAYVTDPSGRRRVAIFGASTALPTLVNTDGQDLVVDSPRQGTIRLASMADRTVAVYSSTGVLIRTVTLRAGVPEEIDGLATGIYIAGGVKIMIR